ncbi:VWA domain-containing protein [Microbulbifer sp.]|uniref:VWA domain-containing protein n=1 Tax=Microbulbifer sp. TaxID=1908541 RepID=UPI00258927DB|nr:VWA domain-containing protein [Microbulbifer sp.]
MSLVTDFFANMDQFHFLRPALLLLILPAALLCWVLARTVLSSGRLQKVIDPDLLPHLLLRGGEKRPWLFALIFALLTLMILAMAGPSWRKLPTPVYTNQDALVILLDLSPSMRATDLTPNRLTRARLKVLDILKQRKDGLTALIAYAGEAYVVTPLTDDTETIANLVPPLSPRIMPVPGSNIEMAVEEGLKLIQDGANGHGELLAVTDGIAKEAIGTIKDTLRGTDVSLSILAVGSGEGSPIPKTNGSGFITDDSGSIVITNFDRKALDKLATGTGGRFAEISVNDSDIERLLPENTAPEEAELAERQFDQWREEGPWLVLLLLPFALLLFRRGALACLLPVAILLAPSQDVSAQELPAPQNNQENAPQENSGSVWQDLWQTKDQQGRSLLEQGNPEQAANTFENSQWRGTAQYRAGKYDAAAKNFAQNQSAQGLYNLGNSLTQQQRYDEALQAYDEALKKNPNFADAAHNRDIAEKLKKMQQQSQQQSQQGQDQQEQDQQNQDQQQSDQQQSQQQDGQQQDQNQSGSQDQQQSQGQPQETDQQEQQGDQDQQEAGQEEQEQQNAQQEEPQTDGEPTQEQQAANAEESPIDPETQQVLDQWLRQIPDDPAGLMREKFKYESLQRRRAYRAGEWKPPENGATQRW